MLQKKYFAEIDGLRAIAVLGVIFFHLGFSSFSGGFIGVDIFFVISGFLMTRNIIVNMQKGSFSFSKFYIRRMRRLLPVFFVVLFLTLIFGYLLFAPEHLIKLGKSLIYSLLGISNFFFLGETGYFNGISEFKPLLHTWSLAVEWQFYILLPVIFFFLFRFKRKSKIPFYLILGGIVSLYFSEKLLTIDPSAVFFLLPFRVVEFALGAILVWLLQFQPRRKIIFELFMILGLALIFYGFFSFTKNTPFPGFYAMIPCLGAVFVIYGSQCKFVSFLLKNPLSVGIGLISYSLYLIHWPVLVFYRYWKNSELLFKEQILFLIIIFLLSYLSYKFIETPFYKRKIQEKKNSQRIFIWFSVLFVILLIFFSLIVVQKSGFPNRVETRFLQINSDDNFYNRSYGGIGHRFSVMGTLGESKTNFEDYDVILMGDSYSLQYAAGLDILFNQQNITAITIIDYGCLFGPNLTLLNKKAKNNTCIVQNKLFFDLLKNNTKPIIWSQSWESYDLFICDFNGDQIEFETDDQYNDFMITNIKQVRDRIMPEVQLIIIGDTPTMGKNFGISSCLSRSKYFQSNCIKSMTFPKSEAMGIEINSRILNYTNLEKNIVFLNPFEVFCDDDFCYSFDLGKNKVWYQDKSHLSVSGSIEAINYFEKDIIRIIKDSK